MSFNRDQIKRTEEHLARRFPAPRRKFEMLTAAEEFELATAWRDHGNIRARNLLIEWHFPLAGKIMKKYGGASIPLLWQLVEHRKPGEELRKARDDGGHPAYDIGQAALIGLIEAANRFDPSLGNRFSTYAQWWVRKEISGYIAYNREKCGADKNGSDKLSLNTRIKNGGADDEGYKGGDEHQDRLVAGPDGVPVYYKDELWQQSQIDEGVTQQRHEAIALALAELPDRDRKIFEGQYLSDPKITLKALAAEFKISVKRTHVIATRAFEQVKEVVQETVALLPQVKMAA
jgi:RNA polymerase sigma-32 factor